MLDIPGKVEEKRPRRRSDALVGSNPLPTRKNSMLYTSHTTEQHGVTSSGRNRHWKESQPLGSIEEHDAERKS